MIYSEILKPNFMKLSDVVDAFHARSCEKEAPPCHQRQANLDLRENSYNFIPENAEKLL
jgi:hypothetical protein